MIDYLTIKQVRDACNKYPYLLLRESNGYVMGINSKVAFMGRNKHRDGNKKTEFIGFRPCSLIEYIEYKHPFM